MYNRKIYTKEVCTANNLYLFLGVISITLITIIECLVIRNFFVKPIDEAILLAILLQLPCALCSLFAILIHAWKYRTDFTIYYSKMETGVDIDYIKENYCVKDIDMYGIVFVKKEDSGNFDIWEIFQGYDDISDFGEKIINTNSQ